MANPTFRSSSGAADQTGSTFSVTKPGGTVDGDILVAFQTTALGGGSNPATPTEWTIGRTAISWNTGINSLQCFYRVVAGDGASYTFNGPGGGSLPSTTVYIICIQGPPATSPEGTSGTNGSSNAADPGTYTTTNPNDLILEAWTNTFGTITPDGSFTVFGTIGTTVQLNVGYKIQAIAGVVNNRSATLGFSGAWAAMLAAIAPTSVGRLLRGSTQLDGLGGVGQQTINPSMVGL